MQLRIRVGAVAIARASRAEHHVATLYGALVHLPQMDGRKVDLKRTLVAKGLKADVTLDALLTSSRIDKLSTKWTKRIPASFQSATNRSLTVTVAFPSLTVVITMTG